MIKESQYVYRVAVSKCDCEGCNAGQCSPSCALGCAVPLVSTAEAQAAGQVLAQASTSGSLYLMAAV